MSGNDAERRAGASDQGRRVHGAHAGVEYDLQRGRSEKDRAVGDVFDRDRIAILEGESARGVSAGNAIEEFEKGPAESSLRLDAESR